MKTLLIATSLLTAALSLSSCATISKDECVAGGWEDIGFRDGENGKSQARLADYNSTCAKFAVTPDRTAYLRGYDQGLQLYCDFDRGLSRGANGNSTETICQAFPDSDYFIGYDQGLTSYCSYDTGYNHGVEASSPAELCRTVPNKGYFDGYEEGQITHALYAERDQMLVRYSRLQEDLFGTRSNMKKENISEGELRRLRKKAARIEADLVDMKVDIRVFERLNHLIESDI
jgi:hypothetical protein